MSSKWQSRVQALVPLTEQEESVKELLEGLRVQYQAHAVFPYLNRSMVVDFFVPRPNVVIECWRSESRRGSALMWVEKNAAYVDLKFARLKDGYHGIRCLRFVEALQVNLDSLKRIVGAVMVHADSMTYEFAELTKFIQSLRC